MCIVTYSVLGWKNWKKGFTEKQSKANKAQDQFTLEAGPHLLGLHEWIKESHATLPMLRMKNLELEASLNTMSTMLVRISSHVDLPPRAASPGLPNQTADTAEDSSLVTKVA